MQHNLNHRIAAVVASTLIVTVAACATSDEPDRNAAGPAAANLTAQRPDVNVNDNLTWGDDDSHFIVTTANAADAPADAIVPEAGVSDDGSADGPARAMHSSSDDIDGTIITRADGTVEVVTIQRESLTFAVSTSIDEIAAMAAAGPGAFVVIDTNGVAGPAGVRYVSVGNTLTEITSSSDTGWIPVESSSPDDTVAAPGVLGGTDAVIAEQIEAIDGVLSATLIGPGIIEVVGDAGNVGLPDEIASIGGVVSVADDVLLGFTSDPLQGEQWAIENTGSTSQAGGWPGVVAADTAAPPAWTVANGNGVTVAVLDSGVQLDHPDLASQIWTNPGETSCTNGVDDDRNGFVDDCNGWDFGSGDKNPNPDAGAPHAEHGTHVAGIIAAAANGVGTVGVAPGAKIMALKVANSSGGISGSAVAAAINYARANGAKVINMSIGTAPGTSRTSISSIETATNAATAAGVVVVVGAGNNTLDITTTTVWPAGLSVYNTGVITAGASTNSDTLASFSNTGAPISLVAPGWWIMSTVLDSSWGYLSGTSMASPYVAGSAAVVVSSGRVTAPAEVRSRLVATADTTAAGKRLNVAAAVGVARTAVAPADLGVSYSGVNALRADTAGTVGLTLTAGATSGVTQVRLSVATNEAGTVAAVEGLIGTFADSAGTLATAASSDQGAFTTVALRDTTGLHGVGALLNASLSLPAGDYAFVTEMLDGGGVNVGGAQVAYVTISNSPGSSSGDGPATTVAASPIPTTPASGDGSTATTTPASGGTATTTAPVSGGGGTPTTTAPASGGGGATTTAPAGTPTTTTAGAPVTTTPTPPTTVRATPGTGTTPSATTTTTPAATTTAPATQTTTPTPTPVTQGAYAFRTISPRISSMCGGTRATITGTFPTSVGVYVWFGPSGPIAAATGSASSMSLDVPAVVSARIVDVTVKFSTTSTYAMTLVKAFTYTNVPGGCTSTVPATTTTSPSSGGATTTTVASGGATTTTVASSRATTTTAPPGGSGATAPATTAPATTAPATTAPGATTTTAPSSGGSGPAGPGTVGSRGSLTLRMVSAGGVLAGLSASAWPSAGCQQNVCSANNL